MEWCNHCKRDREIKYEQYSEALKKRFGVFKVCGHWIVLQDANNEINTIPSEPITAEQGLHVNVNQSFFTEQFTKITSTLIASQKRNVSIIESMKESFYNDTEDELSRIWKEEKLDPTWEKAFHFQMEGVKFAEKRYAFLAEKGLKGGVLIADEMGLGKTIQGLLFLRRMIQKNGIENAPTVLFVSPASLTFNWAKEYLTWAIGDLVDLKDSKNYQFMPIVKLDGQTPLLPGFKFYFVSQDLLRKEKVSASIQNIPFDVLIVDECHKFKNVQSARTEALMEAVEHIPFKLMLSGTPITNRFTEYYTALHLISPTDWPNIGRMYDFAEFGPKNQVLGLKSYKTKQFFDMTKEYIIRRKRSEVMKDLPPVIRDKKIIAVNTNKKLVTAYNAILDEIDKELNSDKHGKSMFIIAKMQELRHLTGLMKVAAAADFIEEFTLSKEHHEKLTIGCHHHDVEDYFVKLLQTIYNLTPIHSNGKDNVYAKMEKEAKFRKPENRFAVLGINAWGEGRNLQFCQNALVVERQWTPAIEHQFELRFSRPLFCTKCKDETGEQILYKQPERGIYICPRCDHMHVQENVMITYLLAKGTIDEFFDELVEMKRAINNQVMDESWSLENDPDMIMALAHKVVATRMKFV